MTFIQSEATVCIYFALDRRTSQCCNDIDDNRSMQRCSPIAISREISLTSRILVWLNQNVFMVTWLQADALLHLVQDKALINAAVYKLGELNCVMELPICIWHCTDSQSIPNDWEYVILLGHAPLPACTGESELVQLHHIEQGWTMMSVHLW